MLWSAWAAAQSVSEEMCQTPDSCIWQLRFGETQQKQEYAAIVLGEMRVAAAESALTFALQHATAFTIRAKAAWALGRIGTSSALESIVTYGASDPASEVRLTTMSSLSNYKSALSQAVLADALANDDSWEVREQAAISLGEFMAPSAESSLAQALAEDARPEVREVAAMGLSLLPSINDAVIPIRALESDSSWKVRAMAALALAKASGQTVVDNLISALANEAVPAVRSRICEALGSHPLEASFLSLLDRVTNDGSLTVRLAAIRALAIMNTDNARDALLYYSEASDIAQIKNLAATLLENTPLPADRSGVTAPTAP